MNIRQLLFDFLFTLLFKGMFMWELALSYIYFRSLLHNNAPYKPETKLRGKFNFCIKTESSVGHDKEIFDLESFSFDLLSSYFLQLIILGVYMEELKENE